VKLANRKLKLPSGNRGREYVQNKNATNAKRNLALRRPSDLLSLAINAVLCTRAVQFAVVVDVGDNRLPVQENKNNNAWLSDSETRIACLFAMCRCGAPAAAAAAATVGMDPFVPDIVHNRLHMMVSCRRRVHCRLASHKDQSSDHYMYTLSTADLTYVVERHGICLHQYIQMTVKFT